MSLLFLSICVYVQDLNKRLSLPADIRIPDGYLEKLQLSSPPFDQPLSRRSRRASLVRQRGGAEGEGEMSEGGMEGECDAGTEKKHFKSLERSQMEKEYILIREITI